MSGEIDRRQFLRGGAAAALIIGFPSAAPAAEGPQPNPRVHHGPQADPFAAARERVRAEARPGVALLTPADPAAGNAVAGLGALPDSKTPAVHALFCQAVFVCLPEAEARRRWKDLQPGAGAVLFDAEAALVDSLPAGPPVKCLAATGCTAFNPHIARGKFRTVMVDGKAVTEQELAEGVKVPELFTETPFAERVAALLHGKDGGRLAASARAQRAASAAEAAAAEAALADLNSDDFETREAATGRLAKAALRVPAVLVQARKTGSPEVRSRIALVFDAAFAKAAGEAPGVRLPYGVQWQTQHIDTCPGCGLGSSSQPSRRFLTMTAAEKK